MTRADLYPHHLKMLAFARWLFRRLLRHMTEEDALSAVLDVVEHLGEAPQPPKPHTLEQIRTDARTAELIAQGTSVDAAALRQGCDRTTIYRRQERALALRQSLRKIA